MIKVYSIKPVTKKEYLRIKNILLSKGYKAKTNGDISMTYMNDKSDDVVLYRHLIK